MRKKIKHNTQTVMINFTDAAIYVLDLKENSQSPIIFKSNFIKPSENVCLKAGNLFLYLLRAS